MVWLWVEQPAEDGEELPLYVAALGVLVIGAFAFFGLYIVWQVLRSNRRQAFLLEVLEREPERIARIFGAVMRPYPNVRRAPIQPPEAEHVPAGFGAHHVIVELANPSLLDRALGRHQHAIVAPPEEIPVLLDWLRSKAPNAAGPPGL
jgi:hypothetical protein